MWLITEKLTSNWFWNAFLLKQFLGTVRFNPQVTASLLAALFSKLIFSLLSCVLVDSDLVWHLQKGPKRKPTAVGSLVGDNVGLLLRLRNTLQLVLRGGLHDTLSSSCHKPTQSIWDHTWNLEQLHYSAAFPYLHAVRNHQLRVFLSTITLISNSTDQIELIMKILRLVWWAAHQRRLCCQRGHCWNQIQ